MKMPLLLVCCSLLIFPCRAAAELGHDWGLPNSVTNQSFWNDRLEVAPHLEPELWLVDRLLEFNSGEIVLVNLSGKALMLIDVEQLETLNRIHRQMERVAEMKAQLALFPGAAPNASAGTADGAYVVAVNFAMLELIGHDEHMWAALIGHELAHLKLSHGRKRATRNLPINILKKVSNTVLDPLAAIGSNVLLDGVGNAFSRGDETQADYLGVLWAVENHYDAYGAANLHRQLDERRDSFDIPFLSTHPSGKKRIEELTALAKRLSPPPR